MGYTWTAIVGYVVFGLIADLVLKAGKYKNFKVDVIGYWLFSCGMIGCQAPMWVMADTYMAQVEASMGEQYASELAHYMPSWMGIAAIAIIFIGSLLGALLGRKMLKNILKGQVLSNGTVRGLSTTQKKGFYLDPRTKVLFMAFVTMLMFFVYENLAMDAAVAIIPLTLLLINRQMRTALIYGGLFALAIVAKLTQGMYVLPAILNMVSVLLVAMVIRLFPIFMLGYYIIESTSTDEFVAAMEKWHVPEAFIIPITVVFRFIPTLGEESAAITDAMRMREIQFGTKKFWQNPTALLEYRVIPLMMSVVKIGDELSAAALTRGLGGLNHRTSIAHIGFTVYDLIIAVLSAGLLVWACL